MAIQTITGQETGSQFIDKLNGNFAECQTGGGDGTISVKAVLQGGELKSSTGYTDGKWCSVSTPSIGTSVDNYFAGYYTDDDFNKYLHTGCYLSLKGNAVKSVTKPSGSTLTIFCYDDTFALLSTNGTVNAVENIPSTAKYVKFQIYNSSGYTTVPALAMTLAAQPKWVKNSFTPLTPQYHNFECHPPKFFDNAACTTPHTSPTGATADEDLTRYHDNCFVMLPPNYTPDGKPTKFIIFFSGDASMFFMAHTPFVCRDSNGKASASIYEQNFKYLNNMGYAVVSCSGYTSMWGNEYGATRPTWWIGKIKPSYIASLRAFYDFLMENYNFDYRPYLAAKSAGGYMLVHTASYMPFPIRAAAGFSIGINLCSTIRGQLLNAQKSWQKMMGHPDWDDFVLNSGSTITQRANPNSSNANEKNDGDLLKAQQDIYRPLDPFLANAEIDYDTYFDATLDGQSTTTAEMRAAMHKVTPIPVKLWCATNDTAVTYSAHEELVDIITHGGGKAEMRSYTGSDGNHATFCGEGGKTANPTTVYGGTMSGVNIGFIEAVDWFRRW